VSIEFADWFVTVFVVVVAVRRDKLEAGNMERRVKRMQGDQNSLLRKVRAFKIDRAAPRLEPALTCTLTFAGEVCAAEHFTLPLRGLAGGSHNTERFDAADPSVDC